jgi:cytochrome P450
MASTQQTLVSERALPATPAVALPGPKPAPLIGWYREVFRWSRDPIGYLTALYENFGTLSGWQMKRPRVFAFGPSYNEQILRNPELFRMMMMPQAGPQPTPKGSEALTCLRSGLLTLDGETHKQHRQVMAPAFSHREIERHRAAIVAITGRMLDGWRAGETRDVEQEMRGLVHKIALRAILGVEDENETERIARLIEQFVSSAPGALGFPIRLPGTSYNRFLGGAQKIYKLLETFVAQKRAQSDHTDDALAILVRARDERGAALTDAQLIGEAYNVLCHESTASTLTWALFLIAQHPEIGASLAEELHSTLRGEEPSGKQSEELVLLDRVVKETLRIVPAAPYSRRVSAAAFSFGDIGFPEGTVVFFSQYITQRMSSIFPEPRKFLPVRWEKHKPTTYEYFPFGAGAHNCIGATFALLEMKVILAMLMQRFRLTVPQGARVDRRFELSLRPKRGMKMKIATQDRGGRKSVVTGDITQMVDLS